MKYLIPIDNSSYTKVVLDFVANRSANFGANSEFLVVNVQPISLLSYIFKQTEAQKALEEEAMEILKPAVKELQDAGLNAKPIYETGGIAETINAIADKNNVDLIIMGSKGTSSIEGIIFGSVTNKLLAITYKPMLILHDKPVKLNDEPSIGLADDGSIYAEHAVEFVGKHSSLFGKSPKYILINVEEKPAPLSRDYALERKARKERKVEIGEVFEHAEDLLKGTGAEIERVKLTSDDPGKAIAHYAKKEDLDLIVIGTRGQGEFRASVLGSTATRLTALSEIPLLIVQTDEDKVKDEEEQKEEKGDFEP
ncbi:MAG: universal stress protein [Burkholderiales bacterium]|nr:universal stress protein [Burkholderiales bacterium]